MRFNSIWLASDGIIVLIESKSLVVTFTETVLQLKFEFLSYNLSGISTPIDVFCVILLFSTEPINERAIDWRTIAFSNPITVIHVHVFQNTSNVYSLVKPITVIARKDEKPPWNTLEPAWLRANLTLYSRFLLGMMQESGVLVVRYLYNMCTEYSMAIQRAKPTFTANVLFRVKSQ